LSSGAREGDRNDGDGDALEARLASASTAAPEEALAESEENGEALRLLDLLDERARAVVVARFGLDGKPPRTLAEVASGYGLSREGVRQIERRALERMRRAASAHRSPNGVGAADRRGPAATPAPQ